jgi:CSLREA domain-containing protein
MSGLLLVLGLLFASLAPLIGAPVPVAHAATFTVNDGGDSGNNNCNDGTCTLRDAITAANFTGGADIIDFAPGVTQVTLNGSSNIVVTDDVTIDGGDGENRVTITRSISRRVFQVGSGAAVTVTFENLVIEGGNLASGNGGGIFVATEGTLTLRNSIVRNNETNLGNGGGIYNAGILIMTNGSEVSGNSAAGSIGGDGIYNAGTLNISGNSVIRDNRVSALIPGGNGGDGGGIHNADGGSVTVTSSTIENNRVGTTIGNLNDGGGIYNAAGGTVDITSSVLNNNRANNGGGVFNAGELTIDASTFTNNLATTASGPSAGGAIYNIGGGSTSVIDSTFTSNRTDINPSTDPNDRGGAIFNAAAGTLMVANSSFGTGTMDDFNQAVGGGAIYNAGELTVTESDLDFNRALVAGGGIWNNTAGTTTIRDSTLSQNEALAETGGGGGILHTSTAEMTIIGSTLDANNAREGGGIINAGPMQIINSTLSANTTETQSFFNDRGGGIANNAPGTLTIVQSTLVGNVSIENNDRGGGVYNAATLTLINSVIADSTGEDLVNAGGTVTPQGNNIIADGSFTGAGISSGDPNLGQLKDNGGPTETHMPQTGSPAIDTGDDSFLSESALSIDFTGDGDTDDTLTTDQRSYARIANGTVDIGAVEVGGGAIAYSIALDTTSSAEGDDGDTTEMTITVTRSGATAVDSSVDVTLGGTATEGSDYTFALMGSGASFDATTGMLSFAAGTTAATFAITVLGDTIPESDEMVIVTLSNATAPETATISTAEATLTIQDDDGAPSVYLPLISR